MTDQSGSETESTRRQIGPRTLLALMLLSAVVSAGLGMAFSGNPGAVDVSDDVPLRSPDGVTLEVQNGGDKLQEGNPFPASNAIQFRNTTFIGASGSTDANLTARNGTHVGIGDLSGDRMEINGSFTKYSYGAEPGIDSLILNKSLDLSEDKDFIEATYSAGSQPTIDLLNTTVSEGRGVVANSSNGMVVDAASADANGNVRFNELPSGSSALNFELGAADLKIFNKSAPSTLVKEPIRVRFFKQNGNLAKEVTVSDGTVDLSNLDLSDSYTITFRDTDSTVPNYRELSISLNQLTEQTQVYMQPVQEPVAYVTFKLDDLTGDFPGSTTDLKVEEPIRKDFDGDNNLETKYQDVAGGNFGQNNQITLELEDQEQFRLRVINRDTNASRNMGTYQTNGNDTVTLKIEDVSIKADGDAGYAIAGELINNSGQRYLTIEFEDPENKTDELSYVARFRKNDSSFAGDTISGPLGTTRVLVNITGHPKNLSYYVDYNVVRNGSTNTGQLYYGQAGEVDLPLDPRWTGILGLALVVASGGLGVIIDDSAGALLMTVVAALLTAIGVISIPSAAIGMAGGISVLAIIGGKS